MNDYFIHLIIYLKTALKIAKIFPQRIKMRTLTILIMLICFGNILVAQQNKFINYRSFDGWDSDTIEYFKQSTREKYTIKGNDTIKNQVNYYQNGKITKRTYYDKTNEGIVKIREINYNWNKNMIESSKQLDLNNDSVLRFNEYRFPVMKSYSIQNRERILLNQKLYNKDSTIAKEYRYLDNGKLDFIIYFSYKGSKVIRRSIREKELFFETIYESIDAKNKVQYFFDHSTPVAFGKNGNYSKLYLFEKVTYDNFDRELQKISNFDNGNVIIVNNNYLNGKLISSEKSLNNCNREISIFKYFED